MVSTLNLPSVCLEEASHSVFDIFVATIKHRISLPFLDRLIEPVRAVWYTPASCQPIAKKVDSSYTIRGFIILRYIS